MTPVQKNKFDKVMAQNNLEVVEAKQYARRSEAHLYSVLAKQGDTYTSFAYNIHSGKMAYARQGKLGFARQYHKLRLG